jgi:Flp pilus assembly pilin Flp
MSKIKGFLWDESGATAFEYGLILGLASLIVFAGIAYFYDQLAGLFSDWGAWFASPTSDTLGRT